MNNRLVYIYIKLFYSIYNIILLEIKNVNKITIQAKKNYGFLSKISII